jgi:hypothetical protein
MNVISLKKIQVKKNRVDYYFDVEGNCKQYFKGNNHLFIKYNLDISNVPLSILTIPFISNIGPIAWITDSVLIVNEIDQSFYNCIEDVKEAYQTMYPKVQFKGAITSAKIEKNIYKPEKEAMQLFSGGVDAVATFIRIRDKKPDIITEFGWLKQDNENNDVWETEKKITAKFAQNNSLDHHFIESNFGTFINSKTLNDHFQGTLKDNWWHGLQHGLALISAAIPIAYLLKAKCIYIASSFSIDFKSACASDPTVDNLIRFASGFVFHDAYELNRQDKIKLILDYYNKSKEKAELKVCYENRLNGQNCGRCEKCLRTILGIVAEGGNPLEFNINVQENLSETVKGFLEQNIKSFTESKLYAWKLIRNRMLENKAKVKYIELLNWFLEYNFEDQQMKSLLKYRIVNFPRILNKRLVHIVKSKKLSKR